MCNMKWGVIRKAKTKIVIYMEFYSLTYAINSK